MIPLSLLCVTLAAAPGAPDAGPHAEVGTRTLLASSWDARSLNSTPAAPGPNAVRLLRYHAEDAPTTPAGAFAASALTSLTGLVTTFGLFAQPPTGIPWSGFGWRARLGASLLLMSVGPSVGDLLNGDWKAFAIGGGVRTLLAYLAWGSVELTAAVPGSGVDGLLLLGSVLLVTVGALVWSGWCAVDLVRSYFAPDRWAERMNAQVHPRAPIAEVRRAGGLAYAF